MKIIDLSGELDSNGLFTGKRSIGDKITNWRNPEVDYVYLSPIKDLIPEPISDPFDMSFRYSQKNVIEAKSRAQ